MPAWCLIQYLRHNTCATNGGYYYNGLFRPMLEDSRQELTFAFEDFVRNKEGQWVENSCLFRGGKTDDDNIDDQLSSSRASERMTIPGPDLFGPQRPFCLLSLIGR